jgi:Fe-S cluster biogenesis protein NfuA
MMIDKNDVAAVLELIRPSLQADGGDVRLVDVADDGTVSVELQGACQGCPLSAMTLANGIERILKERVPGVERVVPAQAE